MTTTKATTTNRKTVTRQERAKQTNEKRLTQTKEQIERQAKEKSIINEKAIEMIEILKQTKDKNNKQFTDILYLIPTVLLHSKINRLQDLAYSDTNRELKQAISKIMNDNGNGTKHEQYMKALNDLYVTRYNENGEQVTICKDKEQAQQIEKLIVNLVNNDGLNIIHFAVLKLWHYIEKAISEKGIENIETDILLKPFELPILHSMTYINGHKKDCSLWQYQTTNAIKETSKEISRQITKLKSIKDTNKCYISTETLVELENGEQVISSHYRQANDISIQATENINGQIVTETANEQTEKTIQNLLEIMNLTTRQAYIFKHCLLNNYNGNGMTTQECANRLKISVENVEMQIQRIRKKVIETSILNTKNIQTISNGNKKKGIVCYMLDESGIEKEISTFESIGSASNILNIDKGNISKVLNGERKTVNGYTFKYAVSR